MGHDILIYAVVAADQKHKDMLEMEMKWKQNQKEMMPRELHEYRFNQGCHFDHSRLNPKGKRIYLTDDRAYNDQSIELSCLPLGTIGIDLVASY